MTPTAGRPHMPGYGILPAGEGTGLLPWDWALTRLRDSHDYYLATVWPDGRPHLMPVWGVWLADHLWFSSAPRSRKVRNLAANPTVSIATDDARNPVVLEGVAAEVHDLQAFVDATNEKYDVAYDIDFFASNTTVRVRPVWAFGVAADDFGGSPTRWTWSG